MCVCVHSSRTCFRRKPRCWSGIALCSSVGAVDYSWYHKLQESLGSWNQLPGAVRKSLGWCVCGKALSGFASGITQMFLWFWDWGLLLPCLMSGCFSVVDGLWAQGVLLGHQWYQASPEWAKQALSQGCSLHLAVAALLGGSYTKLDTAAVISNYAASTYKIWELTSICHDSCFLILLLSLIT